jgi:SNF2 family DNA or RNA helicase
MEQEFYDSLYDYSQNRMKLLVKKIKRKSTDSDMKRLLHSHVMVFILRLRQACNSPWLILNQMKRLIGSKSLSDATLRLKFFNDSENVQLECPICYDSVADRINSPCGHKLCSRCADKMQNSDILNCHMCREFVEEILTIEIESSVKFENTPVFIEELQSSKIDKLIELVNEKLKLNEKVVIVSQWVKFLDIIRKTFETSNLKDVKSISLQGNVLLHERTKLINEFQNDIKVKICFVSLNSSAEGITLTAANNLFLMDKWWAPSKTLQVCERLHRISQVKDVKIYQLAINNTIEGKIEKMLVRKNKMSELCLNRWSIDDLENYDSEWLTEEIKLIERLPEPELEPVLELELESE